MDAGDVDEIWLPREATAENAQENFGGALPESPDPAPEAPSAVASVEQLEDAASSDRAEGAADVAGTADSAASEDIAVAQSSNADGAAEAGADGAEGTEPGAPASQDTLEHPQDEEALVDGVVAAAENLAAASDEADGKTTASPAGEGQLDDEAVPQAPPLPDVEEREAADGGDGAGGATSGDDQAGATSPPDAPAPEGAEAEATQEPADETAADSAGDANEGEQSGADEEGGPGEDALPEAPPGLEAPPPAEGAGPAAADDRSESTADSPQLDAAPQLDAPALGGSVADAAAESADETGTSAPKAATAMTTADETGASSAEGSDAASPAEVAAIASGPGPDAAVADGVEAESEAAQGTGTAPDAVNAELSFTASAPPAPVPASVAFAPGEGDSKAMKIGAACFVMFRVQGALEQHWQERVPLDMPALELQQALAGKLGVSAAALRLLYRGVELVATQTFQVFGVSEDAYIEAEVLVDDGVSVDTPAPSTAPQAAPAPGAAAASPPHIPRDPVTLQVTVNLGPHEEPRVVNVLMDTAGLERKRYLGGYRHKRNGCVYHHAETQTPRAASGPLRADRFSRDCQTKETQNRGAQNLREAGTQMDRPGVLLDTSNDRTVTPGRYFSAEELERLKVAKTIIIQRHARGWAARRRAAKLRAHRDELLAFLAAREQTQRSEAEQRRRKEIERRMHPRTAADFEVLYNELEAWRLQETRKIKLGELPPEEMQASLRTLLHKETKLLQTIDRLKQVASKENKEVTIRAMMRDLSKPKTWDLANGKTVTVHTPLTTRARELSHLYHGVNLPLLSIEERLDVLLHIKWTVKEFDCNLTREIVDLVDREADLLNRGRSPKTLDGLRKRISGLFLAFIETPEFNPEAAKLQVVSMPPDAYVHDHVGMITSQAPAMRLA